MRLDDDLIRALLLNAEGAEAIDLSGYSKEQIDYHHYHLIEAGYLRGTTAQGPGEPYIALVSDLTWAGHEFLRNARNDTVWNRTKAEVMRLGGNVSIALLADILKKAASNHFGL